MKKIFLAIYFMVVFGTSALNAAVTEMKDIDKPVNKEKPIDTSLPDGMPNPKNLDEVIAFFKERFRTASVSKFTEEELNSSSSMNIQHSAEYINQMQEEKKSTFEKMYERAIGRITDTSSNDTIPSDTVFYELASDNIQNEIINPQTPNIPVVNVTLPTGQKIIAPAREHIPYMIASYNILPTGLIQVQEDITVVANGQKLKNGLTKIIRKNSISRAGVRKKLDMQLLSVTINGTEVPHILEEIGDKIYIKPQQSYILQPGVYTYSFKYLLDRKLWYYDDFSEFYVDVTGSYLNLVITSANALISVPDGRNFMTQNVMIGSPKHLNPNRAIIASLDSNALGIASVTPLLPGEGMHVLVSLDKNVFLEPDWNRRFVWMITDYGDVLFMLAGFLVIFCSYYLSLKGMKKNRKINNSKSNSSAMDMRYSSTKNFDNRCFVAGLLELVRKNIIDIQKQDESILLVKKTDNLSNLNRSFKQAVNSLFVGKDAVLTVSPIQMLKFKRAASALKKGINLHTKFMSLKLNIGYLLFSIAMLLIAETAVAWISINPAQTAFILFSATLTLAFYIWVIRIKFKNKIVRWIVRTLDILVILLVIIFVSIYIKIISTLLLFSMVYCIFEFEKIFSQRNNVIHSKLKDIDELKKYLIQNSETINKTQAFCTYQAYIFALELEKYYPSNTYNQHEYKLDIASKMLSLL